MAILLNYSKHILSQFYTIPVTDPFCVVSPPHILGYANGVAQSIVSFARFLGPVLGGYVSKLFVYANIETPFNFITYGIAMVR